MPPIAPLVYRREDGPFTTSTCSTLNKSTSMLWSAPRPDTSRVLTELLSTFTRSPVNPLIVGRLTAEPKSVTDTPKRLSIEPPRPSVAELAISEPKITRALPDALLLDLSNKDAVTTTSSIRMEPSGAPSSAAAEELNPATRVITPEIK